MSLDLLIENAKVVDGTGAPWFHGTVGVEAETIATVIRQTDHGLSADEKIDADGTVVCPGFIDTHSHSDLALFSDPTLSPKTAQGITTEIVGQDGFSMAPMYRDNGATEWQRHLKGLAGTVDANWTWGSTEEYFNAIRANGVTPNIGMLVGHGTVRFNVLGMDERKPTDSELEEMSNLVTESLEDGAVGFSTGLIYSPQINATTHEVQELASCLAPFGRPFVAHIRSEGTWIWEALNEFTDIGHDADVPIHLSHYKVSGTQQQGKAERANHILEAARERAIDFTAEQYPYTAGNTLLSSLLPPWIHKDGAGEMEAKLTDPDIRDRIRQDIEKWRIEGWENVGALAGWENIHITNLTSEEYASYDGKAVSTIAKEFGEDPVDMICDILVVEEMNATMVIHSMAETDVREIMANERVNIATDGLMGESPHPRTFGTYPRVLGKYVRDENLLTLEEAIRKMTSLPARVMGLESKGLIREGMDADLVVLDPLIVENRATYDDPCRYPKGISHVIINGSFAVRDEEITGATPGQII